LMVNRRGGFSFLCAPRKSACHPGGSAATDRVHCIQPLLTAALPFRRHPRGGGDLYRKKRPSPASLIFRCSLYWILQSLRAFGMTYHRAVSIAFRAEPPASLIFHYSLLLDLSIPCGLSG
jgi:hypothetical protein